MKKLTLTSILAISLICPAFADNENITDENKGCTSDTLTVDSGTAALEADWQANTVHITYYKDGTEIPNIGSEYSSCEYDDTLTLPTAPSKDGYTFAGWTVRSAAPSNPQQTPFDLSTLNANTGGIWYASHGSTDNCYYYYYDESTGIEDEVDDNCSDSHVAGLSAKEWKAGFSYGTVKGQALCSSTNGTWTTAGTPDETGGSVYCWCKATSVDTGNGYQPVASSSWVFNDDYGNADSCAARCANSCAAFVYGDDFFRRAVFGVSQ